jgi:hypothetical protein
MDSPRIVLQGDADAAARAARRMLRALGVNVEGLQVDDAAVCVFSKHALHACVGGECVSALFNPARLDTASVPTTGTVLITTPDAGRWGNDTLAWLHDTGFQMWTQSADGAFAPVEGAAPAHVTGRRTDMLLLPPLPTRTACLVVCLDAPAPATLAVGRFPIAHSPASHTHTFRVDDLEARAGELCLGAGLALHAAAWDVGRLGQLCIVTTADSARVTGFAEGHSWTAHAHVLYAYTLCAGSDMYTLTDAGFVSAGRGTHSTEPCLRVSAINE